MALWVADGALGLFRDGEALWGQPCFALCRERHYCYAAGQQRCCCLHRTTGRPLFDFPLPGGVCAMACFGGHLCALSTEADCLCAFHPSNGRLCLSAPAGNYPRHFAISPCGRYAAIAGGAAGEVLLMDGQLQCLRTFRVPGAAVGLGFLPRGMAVLCAVGDEEISTRLYSISLRGVTEEIFSCPQPPCFLCPLPGGRLWIGCHGGIWQLHNGRPVGRIPCVCPGRIRSTECGPLFADSWQGTVQNEKGCVLYQGREPADFLA